MRITATATQPPAAIADTRAFVAAIIALTAETQGARPFVSDDERDAKLGCIGHLRADYGRRGNEFWTTWFDHCGELKTQAFKDELDMVINHLRGDGNILNSLGTLSEYCHSHPEAKLDVMHRDDIYGFRIDTDDHCYYIRGMLTQGDYNLYCYCYQRSRLEQHLAAPRSWEKTEQHEQEAREPEPQTLTADRKAELFDGLVESVNGLMSDGSWYDIFRGIGMTDAEMKSMELDLPELKVTGHTIEAMAEYVIDQIRNRALPDDEDDDGDDGFPDEVPESARFVFIENDLCVPRLRELLCSGDPIEF